MRKMNLQLFAESILAVGKIKRERMIRYIDATPPSASKAEYSRLGKDLEEHIVEMNANVETKDNIWGETSVNLDSYQPRTSADPYYIKIRESLFGRLQDIVDERQTLDDLKTSVVEAHLWEPVEAADGTYVVYKEDVIIEVSSYGGDTTRYQIPFDTHHTGNRAKGKFVLATKTFTADTRRTESAATVLLIEVGEEVKQDGKKNEESVV